MFTIWPIWPKPRTLHVEPHPKTRTLDSGAIAFTILIEAYILAHYNNLNAYSLSAESAECPVEEKIF